MKSRGIIALVAALGLVLAACGGGTETTTTVGQTTTTSGQPTTTGAPTTTAPALSQWGLPIIDPLDVDQSVDLDISGSSTVFPLSVAVIEKWEDEGGPGYAIESSGSGGGLARFCTAADSDIANSSRPINDDERQNCIDNDREAIEIRVGTDALSLVISKGNYFAQSLTLEEIALAFSAQQGTTWADINPSFPAHPIALFSPATSSGTFDYFNEVVFPDDETSPILSSIAEIVGEDDNITVRGVADDGCTQGNLATTCAIGYFGFAYYQENADVLTAVAVNGVAPNAESVNANTYPISRPLFMYTSVSAIAAKPQIAEFIAYYLNNVNEVIVDVGYFPAPDALLQEAANNIKAAAGW